MIGESSTQLALRDPDIRLMLRVRDDDAAAFEAHKRSAHFLAFDRAVAPLLTEKSVTTYQTAEEAKP